MQDLNGVETREEAMIFDIPEQIELFACHYQGTGVPYPLPRQRPSDEDGVMPDLETIATSHDTILRILRGEERVDSGHFVEEWVNQHGYRAITSWVGYSLHYPTAKAGQIPRPALSWHAEESIEEDYKVFVHLLDDQGQLLAQHDCPPVRGSPPTSGRVLGETILANHLIPVLSGAAPGVHQLLPGTYRSQRGERLAVLSGGKVAVDSLPLSRTRIGGS